MSLEEDALESYEQAVAAEQVIDPDPFLQQAYVLGYLAACSELYGEMGYENEAWLLDPLTKTVEVQIDKLTYLQLRTLWEEKCADASQPSV